MPVSGLIITFYEEPELRARAVAAMAAEPRIELGAALGAKLPVVVDTHDADEDRELWQWLHALPGVLFVDVAGIYFDTNYPEEAGHCDPQGAGDSTPIDLAPRRLR